MDFFRLFCEMNTVNGYVAKILYIDNGNFKVMSVLASVISVSFLLSDFIRKIIYHVRSITY